MHVVAVLKYRSFPLKKFFLVFVEVSERILDDNLRSYGLSFGFHIKNFLSDPFSVVVELV